MVLTVHTYTKIYNEAKYPDNALALYLFYYKNAKYQKTNQPWSTKSFCMKGLGWSKAKVERAKRDLVQLGLVERVPAYGQKTKEYVKLNYMSTEQTTSEIFTQNKQKLGPQNDGGQQNNAQMLKGSNKSNDSVLLRNTVTNQNDLVNLDNSIEQRNTRVDRSTLKPKLNSLKKTTTLNKEKKAAHKKIPSEYIKLIEYWNSFDTLNTHRIKRSKRHVWYDKQTKTIKTVCDTLESIMRGQFYRKLGVDEKFVPKKMKFRLIRRAIKRCALAVSPEYAQNPYKMSMTTFFVTNGNVGEGRTKYRYKYPLLHFILNEPVKYKSKILKKKNTEYPLTVGRILDIIGSDSIEDYNRVAKYVDPAVAMIKRRSNGNFNPNLGELPQRVAEGVKGKLTMDNLHFGFMHLERTFEKHLKFRD